MSDPTTIQQDHPHDPAISAADISAVVCTYTDRRWDRLAAAIGSLEAQTEPLREIILVVDHNPELLERARSEFPGVEVVSNNHPKGLSGARNSGVAAASGTIVASLDDDAVAAEDWSAQMAAAFSDLSVAGAGCLVVADWSGDRPGWFPDEFLWVVGCTYKGVPVETAPIRNPLGAAMAIRKDLIEAAGGYLSELGRVNKIPLGCEETELCVRIRQHHREARFMQNPLARVLHWVPGERMTWQYFRRRCFAEGLSKAAVSRAVGSSDGLESERSYVTRVLPLGVRQGLKDALRGDPSGLARAAAIVAGLTLTVAGYATGLLSGLRGEASSGSVEGPATDMADLSTSA